MIRNSLVSLVPAVLGLGVVLPASAQEAAGPPAEASPTAAATEAAAPAAFELGKPVPALPELEYIQGEALPAALNEPGKVYVIDCWATWCGPCVAAMPHLAKLHNDYREQGLVVLAANVWEREPEKVKPFVEEHQADMPFAVALTGDEQGAFATEWLGPAGVNGIPSTFIVKDGVLIYHDHPARIDEKMIESILAPDFDVESFTKVRAEADAQRQELQELIGGLMQNEDWQGVLDNEARIAALDEDMASQLTLLARINLGRYDELKPRIAELPADSPIEMDQGDVYGMIAGMASASEELSAFAPEALSALRQLPKAENPLNQTSELFSLLRFQALAGEDAALRQATLDEIGSQLDAAANAGQIPAEVGSELKSKLEAANAAESFPPLQEVLSR